MKSNEERAKEIVEGLDAGWCAECRHWRHTIEDEGLCEKTTKLVLTTGRCAFWEKKEGT